MADNFQKISAKYQINSSYGTVGDAELKEGDYTPCYVFCAGISEDMQDEDEILRYMRSALRQSTGIVTFSAIAEEYNHKKVLSAAKKIASAHIIKAKSQHAPYYDVWYIVAPGTKK